MHFVKLIKSASVLTAIFMGNLFYSNTERLFSTADIGNAKLKGIQFLKHIQRADGAICDTLNPLFETWETILAVKAIHHQQPDTNAVAVKNGLVFLAKNTDRAGLICHNQKCKQAYCLETTAVYFNLLQLTGYQEKTKVLQKIIALQKPTGDWDIGNPDVTIQKNFPSVTAFVLNLLHSEAAEARYKKQAINWLLKKQNTQGNWGVAWEYYGCPGYALWPIMKVLENEKTKEALLAKEKAVAYIMQSQNSDGSWLYGKAAFVKQTSAVLQTALMIAALQQAGINKSPAITRGIGFLVSNQQQNGSWDGGNFPIPEKRYNKQEYVFATALAVDVMHHYLLNQ